VHCSAFAYDCQKLTWEKLLSLRGLVVLVLLATGVAAHADTFQFSYSGVTWSYQGTLRNDTFSLQLDPASLTNATLDYPFPGDITYFVPATVNGVTVPNLQLGERPGTSYSDPVDTFYLNSYVNGQWNYYFFISYGNFLSGDPNQPVVNPGTYFLVGENYALLSPVDGWLTVTDLDAPAPTPEPSSVALLSTGLLGLGAALRKRFASEFETDVRISCVPFSRLC